MTDNKKNSSNLERKKNIIQTVKSYMYDASGGDRNEETKYQKTQAVRELQKNQDVESYLAIRLHQLREHDASITNNINMVEHSLQKEGKNSFEADSGNFQKKAKLSIVLMEQMQLGIAEDRQEHEGRLEETYIHQIE